MNENFFLSFKGQRLLDYKNLCEKVALFCENFSTNSKLNERKIPLFIEEAECFLVAFFGLLSLEKEPILVQNYEKDILNKNEFDNIMNAKNSVKIHAKSAAKSANFSLKNISQNALFYIKTSGSSGTPKLVPKTLKQMLDEAQILAKTFKINENDSIISCASNQHLYGLTFQVFLPLVAGARVEKQDLDFLNLFVNFNEKNFIFIASPVLLKSLLQSKDLSALKRAKMIFSAGGVLENGVREILHTCKVVEIYGGSEMGVVARNEGNGFVAFGGVHLSLNEQNRLIISSKWQRNFLDETPFLSSDLAELNGDKLTLLGRFDRIVKIHAKRISLDSVESKIKECALIAEARAFLEPSKTRLSALLTLSENGKKCFLKSGKKGVVKALQGVLFADFGAKIRYFKILEKLPYNAQGKLTQSACVAAFNERVEPEFILLEKGENELRLKGYIGEACFYFEGHFGDFPLTPGFIQVKFALQNARKYFGIKDFLELENVKFLAFLRPFQNCFLNLNLKGDKLYFELFANAQKCCSGRARVSFANSNLTNLGVNLNENSREVVGENSHANSSEISPQNFDKKGI